MRCCFWAVTAQRKLLGEASSAHASGNQSACTNVLPPWQGCQVQTYCVLASVAPGDFWLPSSKRRARQNNARESCATAQAATASTAATAADPGSVWLHGKIPRGVDYLNQLAPGRV